MNKYIAIIGLVLISMVCKAQTPKSEVSLSLYGGQKSSVGFDIVGGHKLLIGLGVGMYYGQQGVGEDFTQIFHWTKYAKDVYQHIEAPHVSIYGITGYKLTEKFSVQVNVGMWTKRRYHNAVDMSGILGNAGFYHTSEDAGINPLVGGSLNYEVKTIGAMVGYDTFSGAKVGITYSF